jgi:hypothetical protein
MSTYSQLPGTLGLSLKRGDTFSVLVDFDITLTGKTVVSTITSLVTGQSVIAPATSVVDAANGQVNVSLTSTQTLSLPAGTYGWEMTWDSGTEKRTALTGFVEVAK